MNAHAEIERTKSVLLHTFESFLADRTAEQLAPFSRAIQALLDRTHGPRYSRSSNASPAWVSAGAFSARAVRAPRNRAMDDVMLTPDRAYVTPSASKRGAIEPLVLLPNHISYSDCEPARDLAVCAPGWAM